MLTFCQENPGKFTYEAPPGFTGSAFVRNIIYEICGYEAVAALPAGRLSPRPWPYRFPDTGRWR